MDLENLIIKCIRAVLRNESYSDKKIVSVINWNYQDIKDIIEKERNFE